MCLAVVLLPLAITPAPAQAQMDPPERELIVDPEELTIDEGSTDSYTVVLSGEPTGDVTVYVLPASNRIGVDKTLLTFTTQNRDTPPSTGWRWRAATPGRPPPG